MYDYARIETNATANAEHAALLATVFENPTLFTPQFIQWQYADNPSGPIVGFNAMAGNVIAAHYVTQPFYGMLNGEKAKGLLSLNTATHADHRGKGLFTLLAEKTYEAAANEGFKFVIGVANQNSVHGFIKKLGFQHVGQLDAKVGPGSVPVSKDVPNQQYSRIWDEAMLNWRLANPSAKYMAKKGHNNIYYSKTHLPFIKSQLYAGQGSYTGQLAGPGFNPLTLYIGKDNGISFKNSLFTNIPDRFKSAPLHLIFKDLTGTGKTLDFENIRFRLIDFDAY